MKNTGAKIMNFYVNAYGAYTCSAMVGGVRNGFNLVVYTSGIVRIAGVPPNSDFYVDDHFRNLDTAFAEISKYYDVDIEQYSRIENVESATKLRANFE